MVELVNVIVAAVCGFILGMAVHSAWLHTQKKRRKWGVNHD
jgi:hypothetical protein